MLVTQNEALFMFVFSAVIWGLALIEREVLFMIVVFFSFLSVILNPYAWLVILLGGVHNSWAAAGGIVGGLLLDMLILNRYDPSNPNGFFRNHTSF